VAVSWVIDADGNGSIDTFGSNERVRSFQSDAPVSVSQSLLLQSVLSGPGGSTHADRNSYGFDGQQQHRQHGAWCLRIKRCLPSLSRTSLAGAPVRLRFIAASHGQGGRTSHQVASAHVSLLLMSMAMASSSQRSVSR